MAVIFWIVAHGLEDVCEVCYCGYESFQLLPIFFHFQELEEDDSVKPM
jgi:hypothetical protein